MFTVESLLQQHEWTHSCFAPMLEHAAKLTADELRKPLKGFGLPSVQSQLIHIAAAEDFWISAAQGKPFADLPRREEWWDYEGYGSAAEIRKFYDITVELTRGFYANLSNAEVFVPRKVMFPNGGSINITPAKMLTHVITHGFHHKGQVVAMCRILGYPPPETDLA